MLNGRILEDTEQAGTRLCERYTVDTPIRVHEEERREREDQWREFVQ